MNLSNFPHFVFRTVDVTGEYAYRPVLTTLFPGFKFSEPLNLIGTDSSYEECGMLYEGLITDFADNLNEANTLIYEKYIKPIEKFEAGSNGVCSGCARNTKRIGELEKKIQDLIKENKTNKLKLEVLNEIVSSTDNYSKKIIPGIEIAMNEDYFKRTLNFNEALETLLFILGEWKNLPASLTWEKYEAEQKEAIKELIKFVVSERFRHKNGYEIDEKAFRQETKRLRTQYQKKLCNAKRDKRMKIEHPDEVM